MKKIHVLVIAALVILVGGGFFIWESMKRNALESLRHALSSNNMHQMATAMLIYRTRNGGQWPDRLDQIAKEVGGEEQYLQLMLNPVTHSEPGYEYVKPPAGTLQLSQVIVLYQLRNGKRDTALPVAYGDGHVADYDSTIANADKPIADRPKGDDKQPAIFSPASTGSIEATWLVKGCKRDGQDDASKKGQSMKFSRGDFTGTIKGRTIKKGDGSYEVKSGNVRPIIQMVVADSNFELSAVTGIYEVQGDMLRLRIKASDNPQPISPADPFDSKPGDGWEVLTLERKK